MTIYFLAFIIAVLSPSLVFLLFKNKKLSLRSQELQNKLQEQLTLISSLKLELDFSSKTLQETK
ncbi:hypothetical protein, partial [uncultured Helicobacter sp.]|uniref:hypothetical protein n=1 Tax=uncultured Helicobacter sp. TaxID=175537 RepID=UPI00262B0780